MANRLQFKRGNGVPGAVLRSGEPAYDLTNNILYVGLNTAGTDNNGGQIIGGKSYVDRVDSIIVSEDNINVGGLATVNNLNVTGVATFANLDIDGGTISGVQQLNVVNIEASGIVTASSGDFQTLTVDLTSTLSGDVTFGSGIQFNDGSGVRITGFSTDGALGGPGGASNEVIPTQQAVREAIDAVVLGEVGSITLDIAGDSGSGSVGLGSTSSDVLTIRGTANEIETVGSGTSITIGLPDDVTITNNLNVGGGVDITGGIQVGGGVTFNGDITVAPGNSLTVEDLTVTGETDLQGVVSIGQTLTVSGPSNLNGNVVIDGDLTVTGTASSVTFEVRDVAIEDRIIELGRIGGDVPTTDTTWETGLALNYRTGGDNKKAGILWQDNAGFNLLADFDETVDSGTQSADPQVDNNVGGGANYVLAKAGVAELFIGDVTTATNKVINSDKDASFEKLYVGAPGDFTGTDIGGGTFKAFAELEADGLVHIYNANFDGGSY